MKRIWGLLRVTPAVLAVLLVGCPRPGVVVTLSPLTADLEVGGELTLTASSSGVFENNYSWTVSDDSVLELSDTEGRSVTVTALAEGHATVTVTGAVSGVATSAEITVGAGSGGQTVVVLGPIQAQLNVGDTYELGAASSSPSDTTFDWTTSDPAVAALSAEQGISVVVTALAEGTADITATGSASGRSSTVRVVVVAGSQGPVIVPGSQLAPGLHVEVEEVVIPADRRPLVRLVLTDDDGNLVAKKELGDARFILAYLAPGEAGEMSRFLSYTTRPEDPDGVPGSGDEQNQAVYDGAGLNGLTTNADGSLTYRFASALPEDYDPALTHQLGMQLSRTYAIDGMAYPLNSVYAFRPDGNEVTELRAVSDSATCNECHVRLQAHGSRREYQLCTLCHNTQSADAQSGNSVDLAQMIHKIHRGADLPSVQGGDPYQIIGFRNSVHDYSTVVFPQDVRNCQVCHNEESAPDAAVFKTKPTLAGCASCHDRTWFGPLDQVPEGWTRHTAGPAADSSLCAFCHTPDQIVNAHKLPSQTDDAPGLALDIEEVLADPADGTLRIRFTAMDGAGNPITDLSVLDRVGATYAYPATDYETYASETIFGAGATGTLASSTSPTGQYDFTFASKLPVGTDYTFAVALEGRRNFFHDGRTERQGTATNGLTYFTLNGGTPRMRRSVIDEASCNKCHGEVRMHGDLRVGADYCVMCHNPNETDEARRPAEAMPPSTINFKDMIHFIHSGENLEHGYVAYGRGGPVDFSHVRFPTDRRNCTICHADGGQLLPVADEALPTVISQEGDILSIIDPIRAACTSCHDTEEVDAHAIINTSPAGVESCVVCHGEGSGVAVSFVHDTGP